MSNRTRWAFRVGAIVLGVIMEAIARVIDNVAGSGPMVTALHGAVILSLLVLVWHATRGRQSSELPSVKERENAKSP